MNAAIEKLSAYDRISLWVLQGNKRAIDFYRKYGFDFDGAADEINLGEPKEKLRMIYAKRTRI